MYSYGTNASTTTITTIEMRFFAQQKLEPGRGMPFIYEPISWAQIPVTFWAFLPQGNRFGTNQDSHPLPKTIERQGRIRVCQSTYSCTCSYRSASEKGAHWKFYSKIFDMDFENISYLIRTFLVSDFKYYFEN